MARSGGSSPSTARREFLAAAAIAFSAPALAAHADAADSSPKPRFLDATLRGRVVPFRKAAERWGVELVEDWGADLLALDADDGRVLPLLPTHAARFFYQDPAMWDRPMEIVGRFFPSLGSLEMIEVHSLHGGKPYEIYYWCEICSIQLFQKKRCECCQGPLEVREQPLGEPYRVSTDPSRTAGGDSSASPSK